MHYKDLKSLPAKRMRVYAATVLGIKVDGDASWDAVSENRPRMLEAMIAKHEEMSDPVLGVPGEDKEAKAVGQTRKDEERIKILIHPDENQPEYVYLGHNGDNCLVQRDEEVALPMRFFECLRHARMDVTEFDELGEVRKVRSVPRYHYTVIEAPQEGAVA